MSNAVYAGTSLLNQFGNEYSSDVPDKLGTGINRGIYTAKIIAVGISVIMLISEVLPVSFSPTSNINTFLRET